MTGQIKDITYDYISRKPIISLLIDEELNGIDELRDKKLNIKLTKFCKRRSLDSNSYFHVLCDELRKKLGISMAHCKNDLITSYGQIQYIEEGHAFIYKTNADPEYMREQEFIHMELIKIGEDGAYWYRAYRGSHTYDASEMSQLIEGTIQECKEQGIDTATPDEIAKMNALWEKRRKEYG